MGHHAGSHLSSHTDRAQLERTPEADSHLLGGSSLSSGWPHTGYTDVKPLRSSPSLQGKGEQASNPSYPSNEFSKHPFPQETAAISEQGGAAVHSAALCLLSWTVGVQLSASEQTLTSKTHEKTHLCHLMTETPCYLTCADLVSLAVWSRDKGITGMRSSTWYWPTVGVIP